MVRRRKKFKEPAKILSIPTDCFGEICKWLDFKNWINLSGISAEFRDAMENNNSFDISNMIKKSEVFSFFVDHLKEARKLSNLKGLNKTEVEQRKKFTEINFANVRLLIAKYKLLSIKLDRAVSSHSGDWRYTRSHSEVMDFIKSLALSVQKRKVAIKFFKKEDSKKVDFSVRTEQRVLNKGDVQNVSFLLKILDNKKKEKKIGEFDKPVEIFKTRLRNRKRIDYSKFDSEGEPELKQKEIPKIEDEEIKDKQTFIIPQIDFSKLEIEKIYVNDN